MVAVLLASARSSLYTSKTMDLCADLIAAHLELNDRGWSRQDRLAQMKSKLLKNLTPIEELPTFTRKGSVESINPMANHLQKIELEMASTKTTLTVPDDSAASTTTSGATPASSEESEGYFFPICWFIVALGMMSAWTAMMTFLGVFKKNFGGDIFLWMNAAYYGPALPVLILNLTYGKKIDERCGSYNGYMIRGVGCSAVLAIIMAIHPAMVKSGLGQTWVILESFLIGLFGGMAYGCVFSFNALFCKTCASVFSMGMFAPGFVFMAFQLSTDFSSNPKRKIGDMPLTHMHWVIAAVLSFVGVIALFILLNHPTARGKLSAADEKLKRDAEQKQFEETQLPHLNGAAEKNTELDEEAASNDDDSSMVGVAKTIAVCLVSIFVSIFAIVAITTYFTKIESSGTVGNPALPVILFYVKNSTDFLGRCFTLLPLCIRSQKSLGFAVTVRFLLVPLFFIYAVANIFVSDVFLLLLVAVSGLTSGYINTCCFVVAGQYMKTPSAKSSGAALMNISVQASLIVAIAFGAILSFASPAATGGAAAAAGNSTNATQLLM